MPVIQNLHLLPCGFRSSVSFTGTTEEDACGSILVVSNLKITWLEPHKEQQVQVTAIRGDLPIPLSIHLRLEGFGKRDMYGMVDTKGGNGKGSYAMPLYCMALEIGMT